jgi:hypothetical protein
MYADPMTETQPTSHRRPLAPGEIRSHRVGAQTFAVMHVAGGSYTQACVMPVGGPTRVLATERFEQDAVNAYADAIEQAESDALDAMEGDDTLEPLTAEGAEALAARAGFAPARRCVRTDGSHANHTEPVDGMNCDPDRPTAEDERVTKAQREAFGSPIPAVKRKPGTVFAGSPSRFRDEASAPANMLAHLDQITNTATDLRADADAEDRARTAVADGTARRATLSVRCSTCGGELDWSDPEMATCVKCGDEWSPDHFASAPAPTLADDVAALREHLEKAIELGTDAEAMFDRIAARAPQPTRVWMHRCGSIAVDDKQPPPCPRCVSTPQIPFVRLYTLGEVR